MRKRQEKLSKLLLGLLFSFGVASADEFHYRNFLPGDRAGSMGGAYTAISDDPSGAFYNPAGLALTIGNKLSINVNAFHLSEKSYLKVLPKTTGGAEDWTLRSSGLIPNFFGLTQKFGPGVAGFSYGVTDSISRRQEQVFYNIVSAIPGVYIQRYVININDEDKTYNIGPSYAIEINDRLAFGATLYFHYRNGRIIRNQLLNLSNGEFEWSNGYISFDEYGIKPILGTIITPVDKVSLGLTLSKTYLLHSKRRTQVTYRGISSNNYGVNDVDFNLTEDNKKRELPYEVKFGMAYFPTPTFLIAGDVLYYTKTDDYESVINWSLGTEYYPTSKIALRAGFYTDFANTPSIKAGGKDQRENIDRYGATFGISYFTKNSAITLGAVYAYGTGKAQIIPGRTAVQKVREDTITLFLGASYSY